MINLSTSIITINNSNKTGTSGSVNFFVDLRSKVNLILFYILLLFLLFFDIIVFF